MNGPLSDSHALSGAYAVDALDDLERAAFERHLADCADCRAEVDGLREAAALLAETTAMPPPPALRDRVLAEVATVRPLPPKPAQAPAHAAERPRRRALLLAAAAAVVALGAGAVVVSQQPWEDTPPSATQAVLDAPDSESSSVDLPDGATATVTHSDSLGQAVIVTHDLSEPPDGMVYQLWLAQPEGMVSAGLMPEKSDQTTLLEGDAATATAVGITVEPDGGSPQPTSEPIALFDLGAASG